MVAYLAVTLAILYRAGRKQHDTEDFFLGGRSMPWLAVGLSIMATLLSTNTYLGAPGEMISYGPAYFFGFLAYPIAAAIVLVLWIPFFMRLRLTSAYEYLEQRYDRAGKVRRRRCCSWACGWGGCRWSSIRPRWRWSRCCPSRWRPCRNSWGRRIRSIR